MTKFTRVIGDFDGRKDISKLSIAAVKTMPKIDQKIFLGDIITSITKSIHADDDEEDCFEYSVSVVEELFNILGIKVCQRYNDTNIDEFYTTFRTDLINLMSDHFLDAFETPLEDTNRKKHGFCHMTRPVDYHDISEKTYSFQPDVDVIFVYGNKEHQTITNLIRPIDTHVNDDAIVIRSGTWKSNSPNVGFNTYIITRPLANLLYTYFHLCRIAYMSNGILYIHYGGVGSNGNDRNITLNGVPINVSKIVSGHERMCCIIEGRGIRSYYFDMTGFHTAYDKRARRLHPNEMYITVEGNSISYPLSLHVSRHHLMTKSFYKSNNTYTYIQLTHDDVNDHDICIRSSYYLSNDEPRRQMFIPSSKTASSPPPANGKLTPRTTQPFDKFIIMSRDK